MFEQMNKMPEIFSIGGHIFDKKERFRLVKEEADILFLDHLPVYLDSFSEGGDVRWCEEADFVA